jgi:hypothetical protein
VRRVEERWRIKEEQEALRTVRRVEEQEGLRTTINGMLLLVQTCFTCSGVSMFHVEHY